MKRTVLDFGFVGLLAVALVGGCSSSGGTVSGSGGSQGNGSGGNNSSSGGSTGSGGSSNGSGGSSSSGGSTGSGGSSSGSGGSSSGSGGDSGSGSGGSSAACAAVTTDSIQDFDSTGLTGTIYNGAQDPLMKPTYTNSGSLVMTFATGAPTGQYPYAFVGLPFNNCVDASQYTGITFNVSGTLNDGCTIQFSAVDKEHNKVSDGGTCTLDNCYPGGAIFTLSSSATDMTFKFADQPAGGADPSAASVDATQLKGIQWQVNVPTDGCTGSVTIDNIKFTK